MHRLSCSAGSGNFLRTQLHQFLGLLVGFHRKLSFLSVQRMTGAAEIGASVGVGTGGVGVGLGSVKQFLPSP